MDVEAEIIDLKLRMTVLEHEVKADDGVSVKLFAYVRELRDDIALLRSHAVVSDKRIERLEGRVEQVEASIAALRLEVKELRADVNSLRSEFMTSRAESDAFRKELPAMIAETMREVLREYRGR